MFLIYFQNFLTFNFILIMLRDKNKIKVILKNLLKMKVGTRATNRTAKNLDLEPNREPCQNVTRFAILFYKRKMLASAIIYCA